MQMFYFFSINNIDLSRWLGITFGPEAIGLQKKGSLPFALLQTSVFVAKVIFMIFFFVWVRWSIPRFRYDQLMYLGWKFLLPLSLLNALVTAAIIVFAL